MIHDDPRGKMNVGLKPVRIIDVDMSYTLGLPPCGDTICHATLTSSMNSP